MLGLFFVFFPPSLNQRSASSHTVPKHPWLWQWPLNAVLRGLPFWLIWWTFARSEAQKQDGCCLWHHIVLYAFNLYVYWASQARSVWCYQPPNDSLFFFSCSLDCVQWETTVDTTWVNVFSVSNDHRGPNETLSWEDLCRKLLTPHFHFT